MSKKRTSAEINNEDSDVSRQEDNNAKRGKFVSFSDTTLQDIPTKILQCILVKAIAMEVKDMRLAKSVWKDKADLVIRRLGTVSSQWSSVLTADIFQVELHRALDGIAQEKFRMERVQELYVDCFAFEIVTLKDDVFLLCLCNGQNDETSSSSSSVYNISVYDRNNMEVMKDVIELPGLHAGKIAACNVSNCIYVLKEKFESQCASVMRITKDENQKFNLHAWISDLSWSANSISISDEGGVILSAIPDELHEGPHVIRVYDPNGLLQQEVILSPDIYGSECFDSCVIRKPNGNLALASASKQSALEIQVDLSEIDPNGVIQRQYKSSLGPENDGIFMSAVDAFGRILIHDMYNGIELFDSELNPLEFTAPHSDDDDDIFFSGLHFNRERNEVMGICAADSEFTILRIFSFKEG